MISYILVYRFNSGHHLFSVKGDKKIDGLISGLISALNSFANKIFNLFKKRIDLIAIGDHFIQEFILIEDLDIDIIFIYDKDDHPFITELYEIIKNIVSQKSLRYLFIEDNGSRKEFKNISNMIKSYIDYWKHEKTFKGIPIKNL